MFAGPNGSGKSTIRDVLPAEFLGVYVNPDDLEREMKRSHCFDPRLFGLAAGPHEILDHLRRSTLWKKVEPKLPCREALPVYGGTLDLSGAEIDSYLASGLADFVRTRLLEARISFTFETVMSSGDKVEFLRSARSAGYRVYLYYIATEDPAINRSRVASRVRDGGHDVPPDKIASRYSRSLDLLFEAIRNSDRAYVFDNSSEDRVWVAEITEGKHLEIKTNHVPRWFQRSVLDKVAPLS